jgi:AAA15 family ATPase/GTPase
MKLTEIRIKNFRSIKDLTIKLDPSCRVLAGINESGKSNILKALAMLDEDNLPTKQDVRFSLEDESPITEAYIYFIFDFDEDELAQIYGEFLGLILDENLLNDVGNKRNVIKKLKADVSLKDFCRERSKGLYKIDLIALKKYKTTWQLPKNTYSVEKNWGIPAKTIPKGYMVDVQNEQKPLEDFMLLNLADYPDIPAAYFDIATAEAINNILGDLLKKLIGEKFPDCVYWTYSDKNLLPASIVLATFASNPDSCMPLRNMFELAGIEDIQATITAAQATPHGLRNLLSRVAKQTTLHIKNVWKEYRSIEILLEPNGANIDASVREGFNRFDFSSRSDGFKRFVSFLIMVSAKVKTDQLQNTLILMDEPEIGLHPSGARYLKDELLKIAEKNLVVYSTHSIFMVDKENVGRHLLVKKQNEVTVATEVNQSNFVDEEVVYNALGHSIFDGLKETNILFEGWRDKKLFQVALESKQKFHKKLKGEFQKMGIAHLQGVKDVGRVCPILELANRNYIIISDCDQAAKAEQKKFTGLGQWKRWDELSTAAEIVTGEDFIKSPHIITVVARVKEQYTQLNGLSTDLLNLSAGGGKLHCIDRWIGSAIHGEEKKAFLNQIKDDSINLLAHEDIEEVFYEYLQKLLDYILQVVK